MNIYLECGKKNEEFCRIYQVFPYKTQVQIIVVSMTLNNYIRRKSQEDIAFRKFDRHPDFIPDDFLTDVFPWSQTHGNQGRSRMDFVQDVIIASLIGKKKCCNSCGCL